MKTLAIAVLFAAALGAQITSIPQAAGGTGGAPTGSASGDLGASYPGPTVLSLAHLTTGLAPCTITAVSGAITLHGVGTGCNSVAPAQKFIVGPITNTTTLTTNADLIAGPIEVDVTQDATGGRVLNWPAGFVGVCPASTDASTTTVVSGIWDGTALNYPVCRVSGVGIATTISVGGTATPAAGTVRFGWDSTALTWQSVDSNGKLHTMPIVASGKMPTFNNTVTYSGTDGTTITTPATSQTVPGLAQANAWTGAFLQDFSADIVKRAPATPTVSIADFICDSVATIGQYVCGATVGTTETYFANSITIPVATTANKLDGTHQGLHVRYNFDLPSTGGSTITAVLNACSAFSGGVCTGRVKLFQFLGSAVTDAAGLAFPADCDIYATATATTLITNCVARVFSPAAVSPVVASVPNAGTNWVIVWSVTFGTASTATAIAQNVIYPEWIN